MLTMLYPLVLALFNANVESVALEESTSPSEPRIIGTNHEPSKIIEELTSGNSMNPESILTLSLIGALALVTTSLVGLNSGQLSKRRSEAHRYYDYYDNEYVPQPTYVENIHKFENKVFNKFKKGVSNSLRRARIVGRRTSLGIGNVVHGVARVGTLVGSGIDRMGRVLSLGTKNGLRRAFSTIRGASYRAGRGVRTFMRKYNNGLSRLSKTVYNLKHRAGKGLSFLGILANTGVSRMGYAASSGFSRIGSLAADSAVTIFKTALNVPLGIATAAKERAVQDCLIQTVCYISSPLFTSRKKRMISYANGIYTNYNSTTRDLTKESRQYNSEFKMEDCEVFECRLASLGRKAFGVISKMQNKKSDTP